MSADVTAREARITRATQNAWRCVLVLMTVRRWLPLLQVRLDDGTVIDPAWRPHAPLTAQARRALRHV